MSALTDRPIAKLPHSSHRGNHGVCGRSSMPASPMTVFDGYVHYAPRVVSQRDLGSVRAPGLLRGEEWTPSVQWR